jgi:GGDEF domain-containing protein
MNLGVDRAARLMDQLETTISSLVESPDCGVRTDDARFALVLRDCEREQGLDSVKRVARDIREWSPGQPDADGRVLTFSVGLATLLLPPKNYPAQDLIEAAERCMNGARSAGGDGLKSILI